jgi:hypothetical protein
LYHPEELDIEDFKSKNPVTKAGGLVYLFF